MVEPPAEDVCLVCGDDVADAKNGKQNTHGVYLPFVGLKLIAGFEECVGQIQLEELDERDEGIKEIDVWSPSVRGNLICDIHRIGLAHGNQLVESSQLVLCLNLLNNNLNNRVDVHQSLCLLE